MRKLLVGLAIVLPLIAQSPVNSPKKDEGKKEEPAKPVVIPDSLKLQIVTLQRDLAIQQNIIKEAQLQFTQAQAQVNSLQGSINAKIQEGNALCGKGKVLNPQDFNCK